LNPVPSDLSPARYIRRTGDLRRLMDRLRGEPLVAIDTESNSLYAYYERVCLVQLSTRERDYLIDPLALDDISPMAALLADPAIEIVFHAAEYDVITLKRDFGFAFASIFDTMLAARTCGWNKLGLGNMLEEQFGVHVDKKYQRADWSRRPLPPEQLLYAQMDTHYLPALRDRLMGELARLGHLEEARESFKALASLPPAQHTFDPEGYWRIHDARDLSRNQMAVVRELYLLRDEIARQWDWPPFKVFGDGALVNLAVLSPRHVQDLHAAKGLNGRLIQREGERIVQAVARGLRAKPPRPPQQPRGPNPDVLLRYDALHEWRKQRAAERGVESDVIIPRETLWALARRVPTRVEDLEQIPGLGPWRRAEYGAELIDVLGRTNGSDT
jgi:ribonuclease D